MRWREYRTGCEGRGAKRKGAVGLDGVRVFVVMTDPSGTNRSYAPSGTTGGVDMKELWYGDNRDLVKWGALVQIAQEEGIKKIVQVAFLRETECLSLCVDKKKFPIAREVWDHFRKDLHNVKALGSCFGLGIDIEVIGHPFNARERSQYSRRLKSVLEQLGGVRKIVLLDPDTGIEPRTAKPEHVTVKEVKELWGVLSPGDWLVLYQHRYRDRQWKEKTRSKFSSACEIEDVRIFSGPKVAGDVAWFAAKKL